MCLCGSPYSWVLLSSKRSGYLLTCSHRKYSLFCMCLLGSEHRRHTWTIAVIMHCSLEWTQLRMNQTLRNFFGQYGEIQNKELDIIRPFASQKSIKKGSFLMKEGTVCKNFYLVISGSFRLFYLKDGLDTSVWFSFKNNSSIELYSYISESPSDYFIECIEDAEVIIISKNDIDSLCCKNSTIDALFKSFWQDVVQSLVYRLTSLQKYSAEERYLKLIEDTDYLNRIPQKYIASYIGVTTTSLSRIKRNIRTKLS